MRTILGIKLAQRCRFRFCANCGFCKLLLPSKFQVAIVPCGITVNLKDDERTGLYNACKEYETKLAQAGVRVKGDYRENYSPGWKFNHWELKGVPIRLEVGPRDVKSGQFVAVRRDTGDKLTFNQADSVQDVLKLLDTIQASLFARLVGFDLLLLPRRSKRKR